LCSKDYTLDISNDEIYPMPFFVKLKVSDVERSTEWYARALGFRALFVMSHPVTGRPVTSHLRRARNQDILLVPGARGSGDEGCDIYLNLDGSVDELAASARAAGAEPSEGPADTPWNTREVTFKDPDGYLLTFTTGPVVKRTFDDVVGSISDRMK
jgi:catechol 2,3-dioxygenase-like lactoylglutathione lyase family enzyme